MQTYRHTKDMLGRFWEIDFIRGLAVVLMVVFNYVFALRFFNIYTFDSWFFWFLFPRIIASIFILIAGISLTISYSKIKRQKKSYIYKKYIVRGLKLFSLGLLITAASLVFVPYAAILFGILHFIGVSIILSIFFLRFRKLNFILGVLIIISGIYINTFDFGFSLLFWFLPSKFSTLDYFPLLPWFGVMLVGLFLGNTLYRNGKRRFKARKEIIKPLNFLGRHALIIYLIHIPILMIILYLFGYNLF